jgi:hypothetical protein
MFTRDADHCLPDHCGKILLDILTNLVTAQPFAQREIGNLVMCRASPGTQTNNVVFLAKLSRYQIYLFA